MKRGPVPREHTFSDFCSHRLSNYDLLYVIVCLISYVILAHFKRAQFLTLLTLSVLETSFRVKKFSVCFPWAWANEKESRQIKYLKN